MKAAFLACVGLVLWMALGGVADAAIPLRERSALLVLYHETNGDAWVDNTGWQGPAGSECDWFGVGCDAGETAVVRLDLNNNGLTGPLPQELGDLANLERLSLYSNSLSGPIPPELGQLASLRDLYLCCQELDGAIPEELGELGELEELYLNDNRLTGGIPDSLGSLTSLSELHLNGNELDGAIPAELGSLAALETLSLYRNQLSGPIPPELGSLGRLETLYLCCQDLSGVIPPELGDLVNLRSVALYWNQLSGPIPPELGALASLRSLSLDNNQLSGSIPPELGDLGNVVSLHLNDNQLGGPIPSELGNLTNLESLHLHENQLGGAIPEALGSLGRLQSLLLRSNKLTGAVPTTFLNLSSIEPDRLDLRWNGVYTTDQAVRDLVNAVQVDGDFEATQTVAPAGVAVEAMRADHVTVSWAPIAYTDDEGGYRVFTATNPAGPFELAGETGRKTDSSLVVTGLDPGLSYFFQVATFTNPHGNNQNTVVSESSTIAAGGGSTWVEVAAHVQGLHDSRWSTDVVARNEGSSEATLELILHTADGPVTLSNTVAASAQGVFEDVVGLMGHEGKGALEIRSDQPLRVSARIFNSSDEGSFGQFLDGLTVLDGLAEGDEAWLLQLRQLGGDYRTNIGLTNAGSETATVAVSLYATSGSELATYTVSLQPGELYQDLEPFTRRAGRPDLGWGFARVTVTAGYGVLASASVIDSRTNDPTTIPMRR